MPNRGASRQNYGTPWDFIRAVERRFGPLAVDLAAEPGNAKAPIYLTREQNALTVPWGATFGPALCWLNPEFADIDPWAEKCRTETALTFGLRVIMLTPASVGSEWFAAHVHRKARVLAVRPRLHFEGEPEPYPKDCMVSLFGFGRSGFGVWRWRKPTKRGKGRTR